MGKKHSSIFWLHYTGKPDRAVRGDNDRKKTPMSTLKGALKSQLIDGVRLLLCLSIKTASELRAFWAPVTAERQRLPTPSVTLARNLRLAGAATAPAARRCYVNTSDGDASVTSGRQWVRLWSKEGEEYKNLSY